MENFKPKYCNISDEVFESKIVELKQYLNSCELCFNKCRVDRSTILGKCSSGDILRYASASVHYGEEKMLVGSGGSGTLFFSGCPMSCVYCQNWRISQNCIGSSVTKSEMVDLMLDLQDKGCTNINWVTPTHYVPQLVECLKIARDRGLKLPIVYNTGGYDNPEMVKVLEDVIDIYMPDVKYGSNELGVKYSDVESYWNIVRKNLKEMYRQVGNIELDESNTAVSGLLVRHLVLPDNIEDSKRIMDYIASEVSSSCYVNIMEQYRPMWNSSKFNKIDRPLDREEYNEVRDYAIGLGLNVV